MPDRVRAWWSRRLLVADSILAMSLLAFQLFSLTVNERTAVASGEAVAPATVVSVVLTVLMCAPLALRRVRPAVAFVATTCAFAAFRWVDVDEFTGSGIVLFVSFASAGIHLVPPLRRNLRAGALAVMLIVYIHTLAILDPPDNLEHLTTLTVASGLVYNVAFFAAAWLLGDMIQTRLQREQDLTARAQQLALDRQQRARRAVASERLRIARDLHDIVAHHVSAMGVQAGAARRVVDRDRSAAIGALGNIERSSRHAVEELDRLLGFLRSNDDVRLDPITARPSLQRVGELVDEAERLGLDVHTEICGDTAALAPSIDVAAYRIVQEALTNTRKHAEASTADVTIRVDDRALCIEVVDDGTAMPDDTNTAVRVGHGLIGMRERAALHGGELSAGPLDGGGYRVCADIPVMSS